MLAKKHIGKNIFFWNFFSSFRDFLGFLGPFVIFLVFAVFLEFLGFLGLYEFFWIVRYFRNLQDFCGCSEFSRFIGIFFRILVLYIYILDILCNLGLFGFLRLPGSFGISPNLSEFLGLPGILRDFWEFLKLFRIYAKFFFAFLKNFGASLQKFLDF